MRGVFFSSDRVRAEEARAAARIVLADAGETEVSVEDFRGRFFPFIGAEIKEYFDGLGRDVRPDLVFTHFRDDLHQDHRLISDLTYNTFRDHAILEYEIPKWDGDLGRPNAYVNLDQAQCDAKIQTIMSCFPSQHDKHWFTEETFRGLARLRGIESKSPGGYAEAFYARKLVWT